MKWIKIFESFEKSEWYDKMEFDEYLLWCQGKGIYGKSLPFDKSDIVKIKSVLPSGDYFNILTNGQFITISRKDKESRGVILVKKNVNIYELSIMKFSDDWFTCQVYLREDNKISKISDFYKCDQIDGLIKIIKDVINLI